MRYLANIAASPENQDVPFAAITKNYPEGLAHFDTKRLPRLKSGIRHSAAIPPAMAIDDLSRALYDAIRPDKTPDSAAAFLNQVITEYLYATASYLF
ncbi:hypothetical protein R2083_13745 [Nitrosomonas sp. Is35]|uniref:hypothetical protein n=1 Tax=unclassified Nitrosomonas TaxID=2609265 RepID=UPI00294ABA21|nr:MULTISPECIES: hypothetical protein [unclassified Nitrosomonas]MDV6342686.1 hypothetical protein [Nitrosomonas sp. Is24]MDV6348581.1 hypothetical protein [Nitrosomonas sp. Is35]